MQTAVDAHQALVDAHQAGVNALLGGMAAELAPLRSFVLPGGSRVSRFHCSIGRLDFGPWEQIFYGEFDGRRRKRLVIKVIGE